MKKKKVTVNDSLAARIVEILRARSRSVHQGELRSLLGLSKEEASALWSSLAKLVDQGLITELAGGKYRARSRAERAQAAELQSAQKAEARRKRDRYKGNTRAGRLTVNARGFGFVSTEEPGPDVFVPPHALGGSLDGDRVRVRVTSSPKGLDGKVVDVIERALPYVGGELRLVGGAKFIQVDDERIKAHVQVVGDLPLGARSGQNVIAKVVSFPKTPGEALQANVIEAFDPAEIAPFEIRRILLTHGVTEEFSSEALAEAEALPDELTAAEIEGRTDLRDLGLVTIDPEDARDHDDAVWVERLADGGYRVVVAIADVSHYVKPGNALDREALARGCTIYLPGRAIAMLPSKLSSNLASLLPRKDRLALAVDIELDASGEVRSHRLLECVMRSAARLSYEGAARALGLSSAPVKQPAAESRRALLTDLLEVSKLLGTQRRLRGSLDFDLPEAKVKLDPQTGQPLDIEQSRHDPGVRGAYAMIEELMLLANEVVARDLGARKLPAIYRIHGAPKEEKVQVFVDVARSLGFKLDKDAAQRPDKLAHFLRDDSGTVHTQVLSYLLLRAMQQATYSTDNIGHFGLAAPDYVHFTSPIRRYPDLAVHRLVRTIARREKLRGKKLKEELSEQAVESSRLERRAMAVEREVVDLYRAMLMRDRLGDTFDATVTGITEHGIFAAIEKPFVDVFCRVGALPADQYQIDPYGIRLSGTRSGFTVTLFDPITLRIEEVSVARRRISAVPAASPLDTSGEPKRALRVTAGKRRPSRAPKKPKRAHQDRKARRAAGRNGLVR